MKRYSTYIWALLAASALSFVAGCNKFPDPVSPGKGMNIKPEFCSAITSSATKSGDTAESLNLEPLILDGGVQIDMSVIKDTEWPIAGPQVDAVQTKGDVYSGASDYESMKFRLSAWNASQSNSVCFAAKEYTCDSQHNWNTTEPPVWPGTSDRLAFVGVWDSSESATASIVSGKYTVSEWDVSGAYDAQNDLRVAFATYPADHDSDVILHFNPYLNAIRVVAGNLPAGYSISKVELKNVGVKGTLVFPDTYTPEASGSYSDAHIGDWQSITPGNLSLTGNWTSGTAVTPDGTAFLIIDPDGDSLAGSIEVEFSDSEGNITVKRKDLSELGEDVKCGEAYTINIGSTFIYSFDFVNRDDATQTFENTTASASHSISIKSTVKIDGGTEIPADWIIDSVQIGTGPRLKVTGDGSSYSNTGEKVGLTISKSGNTLTVKAAGRNMIKKGCHEYWINKDDANNPVHDGYDLDWSPADWSGNGVIDLSKYDFQTESTNASMSTANCYIIRHAGTYKLPLVYGNAIKNGKPNPQSYKPAIAYGGDFTYFLSNFINSENSNIVSPFIENNSLEVDSGIVLWQDEANLIHNVTITDGSGAPNPTLPTNSNVSNVRYLQFTISQEEICQNNALIAACDENGNILWSWHIWITNDPDLLMPAISVKNHTNNIYQFFPLPCLGYIDPTNYPGREDIIITLRQKVSNNTIALTVKQPIVLGDEAIGCYYQFGRKDPMCRVDNPVQNGGTGTFNKGGVGKVSLADAIQHPEVFYNYGDPDCFDWCQSEYFNLWSGGYCGTGSIEGSQAGLSKTVYDPSPRGYMMPASNAFTGFTSTGSNTITSSQFNVVGDVDKGWNFKTNIGSTSVLFPAAGYRTNSSGTRSRVGLRGYYWSAVPSGWDFGRNLSFYSGFVGPVYCGSYRSDGFSARPVQE